MVTQIAGWGISQFWIFHDKIWHRKLIFEINKFQIWASEDVPLKRYRWFHQGLCECAMDSRHVAVLLALRVMARERVQNRPSKQGWMCNGYTACDSIVGTTGTGREWVQHHSSRLVWMCNGYTACRHIVGTSGTGPWVSAEQSVKTSVNVQWIDGMSWYCCHYGFCPVSECRTLRQD